MKLSSRLETQKIDQLSTDRFGISSETLMNRAAELAANHIWQFFEKEARKGFSVVAGCGNNGGDALAVALELEKRGASLKAVYIPQETGSDLFEKKLSLMKGRYQLWTGQKIDGEILVDGLFGIGLNRSLGRESVALIRNMQRFQGPVISLDMPSGIDCDTGWDWGASVLATQTLTFGLAKPGLYLNRGYQVSGDVFVLDIGFPEELVNEIAKGFSLYQMMDAAFRLPTREQTSHKANHGRVLILAGSPGRWGAALLCARSASRSGTGFVYVASHEMPNEVLQSNPEFLVSTISEIQDFSVFDAIVIGPGLGTGIQTRDVLSKLKSLNVPVLVDADALTELAASEQAIPENWVLTPHMGEFSRLIQKPVDEIEFNRWQALKYFRARSQATVVLKGFHSQVASWKNFEKVQIVESGNSALAKAGSGDVLSGLIGGFLAQGLSSMDAAALGCYVHGRAADLYIRDRGHPATLLISELFEEIPKVFSELSAARGLR